jgi:RNA recognition motif-containing protein
MEDDAAATAAISQLDGQDFDGRNLRVNEAIAKPRPSRNDYRY